MAPGCTALISSGRYCAEHKVAAASNQRPREARASASARGYDARWRRVRARVIARDPVCRDPFGIHARRCEVALTTDADHIIPKRKGGKDTMDNLQGTCHSCHSTKTARGE